MVYEDQSIKTLLNQEEELGDTDIEEGLPVEPIGDDLEGDTSAVPAEEGESEEEGEGEDDLADEEF
jgi:hypothetical protein